MACTFQTRRLDHSPVAAEVELYWRSFASLRFSLMGSSTSAFSYSSGSYGPHLDLMWWCKSCGHDCNFGFQQCWTCHIAAERPQSWKPRDERENMSEDAERTGIWQRPYGPTYLEFWVIYWPRNHTVDVFFRIKLLIKEHLVFLYGNKNVIRGDCSAQTSPTVLHANMNLCAAETGWSVTSNLSLDWNF